MSLLTSRTQKALDTADDRLARAFPQRRRSGTRQEDGVPAPDRRVDALDRYIDLLLVLIVRAHDAGDARLRDDLCDRVMRALRTLDEIGVKGG